MSKYGCPRLNLREALILPLKNHGTWRCQNSVPTVHSAVFSFFFSAEFCCLLWVCEKKVSREKQRIQKRLVAIKKFLDANATHQITFYFTQQRCWYSMIGIVIKKNQDQFCVLCTLVTIFLCINLLPNCWRILLNYFCSWQKNFMVLIRVVHGTENLVPSRPVTVPWPFEETTIETDVMDLPQNNVKSMLHKPQVILYVNY